MTRLRPTAFARNDTTSRLRRSARNDTTSRLRRSARNDRLELRLQPRCDRPTWNHRRVIGLTALLTEQVVARHHERQTAKQVARKARPYARHTSVLAPEPAKLVT